MMIVVNAADRRMSPRSRAMPIVYVVDDDVTIRESLEALIRLAGWQAEMFASAEAFLSQPRASVPSCLVLDATLPGLCGLEVQRQVAADRPTFRSSSSRIMATSR